jgi:hypothetical protein
MLINVVIREVEAFFLLQPVSKSFNGLLLEPAGDNKAK